MQYVWFAWTLIGLAVWFLIYVWKRNLRKEMLWASLWTSPLGLTEPIFVPEYWTPPSLFNLAERTGFDIESIIFSFVVGGLASILYETAFEVVHIPIGASEHRQRRHAYHGLALISPIVFFILFSVLTAWNPIYSAVLAVVLGSIGVMLCRPDLVKKILTGGVFFTLLYFVFFISLVISFPGYVSLVWNLPALSGILILGIPLEEYLFAFSFGMLWASLYEHIHWYRIRIYEKST